MRLLAGGADDDLADVYRGRLFEGEHDRAGDVAGGESGVGGAAGGGLPRVGIEIVDDTLKVATN